MSQPLPKIQEWFDSRAPVRAEFLARTGWDKAALSAVGEDSAFRRYFRLQTGEGRTAILMEAVPDGSAYVTPGHNMKDFIRISKYMRGLGLRAPEIFETDLQEGYLLLEDFGSTSFKIALDNGTDRTELYALATDVLKFLREKAKAGEIALPEYYASHVHTGRRRLVDWFMPVQKGAPNPDGLVEEYLAVWDGIEKSLPPVPQGFLHIDYHFENLMWMPERADKDRCGILDFQGAMTGPVPYDLANLLEDARVDVPQDLRRAMLDRFCAGMSPDEEQNFRNWYRVLATQFHCRVLGQFIRLAVRDGKPRYLQHLPRVAGYIAEGLKDPVLSPLKAWLDHHGVQFENLTPVDPAKVKHVIRADAF